MKAAIEHPATGGNVTLEYVDATTRYVWTPIYDDYKVRWKIVEDGGTGFWKLFGAIIFDGAVQEQVMHDVVGSVYEYAYSIKPNGEIDYEWTGSGHGNENISSITWKDQDGNDVVVSAGSPTAEREQIILTNAGTTRHSESGAIDLANFESVATFNDQGLQVYHKHDWLTKVYCMASYAAMHPFDDGETIKGHIAGDAGVTYDLTPDDGTYHGNLNSRCIAQWADAHQWVGWCYVTDDAGVGDWFYSGGSMVEDRIGGTINKTYVPRGGKQSAIVDNGAIWETTTLYRFSNVADPDTTIVPI